MVIALLAAVGLLCWPTRRRPGPPARAAGTARGVRGAGAMPAAPRPWVIAAAVTACLLPVAGVAPTVAATTAAWTVTVLLHRAGGDRRRRRDRTDLLAALGMLTRDLQAGAAPATALLAAARAGRGSAPAVLEEVAAIGADPGEPRTSATGSVPHLVGDRLVACWSVSHRHGLPLARLVEALRTDLQSEVEQVGSREAEAAGPRLSGHLLAALPALGLLLGAGMGADPVEVLTGTPVGGVLLVGGVGLTCAGLLWTDRLVSGPDRR